VRHVVRMSPSPQLLHLEVLERIPVEWSQFIFTCVDGPMHCQDSTMQIVLVETFNCIFFHCIRY